MMVQTSQCDDMRTTKHWMGNGNPVLPVCSWTVFHLGSSPAESPGCGSARAAWQSLQGSDSERLLLSPDTV